MGKPLIIAELSANHNGDINIAKDSISVAKEIGADGIKIQTYTPDCLTLNCRSLDFKIKSGLWKDQYLYDLYSKGSMPLQWHEELFSHAKKVGILMFSSPFSIEGFKLLESLECPMYKIASFEINHLELIEAVAKSSKPIILSSGIASFEELKRAVEICKSVGNDDITILKCTSSYPAPIDRANLESMKTIKNKLSIKVGVSDHTKGIIVPIVATALGASMIEKHFILDKSIGGLDSDFSLDKEEFSQMIQSVRDAYSSLGSEEFTEEENKEFGRSIFVSANIKSGEILSVENIGVFRPNKGIHPKEFKNILGKRAKRDLEFGKPLEVRDF